MTITCFEDLPKETQENFSSIFESPNRHIRRKNRCELCKVKIPTTGTKIKNRGENNMFETFEAIGTTVLVKICKENTTTDAGIIVTESKDASYGKGCVMAIGPDVTTLAVGKSCIFGKYAGLAIEDTYRILDIKEIYGTL